MINAILQGLLFAISGLLNILLLPINLIFNSIFPNMGEYISHFNTFVTTYLGSNLGYFWSMFPPITRGLLTLWFTFVGSYYGIRFLYNTSRKVFVLIQKLKFW